MSLLLLPGQQGFSEFLNVPPPDPRHGVNYVVRSGGGLAEAVNDDELAEYFKSGEYDERLSQIEAEETEIPTDAEMVSDVLYLPCSVVL
ncbi:MAG: hypothetical protein AAFW84_21360 [Cyanobacteria bacterium J06635_15]